MDSVQFLISDDDDLPVINDECQLSVMLYYSQCTQFVHQMTASFISQF